MKKFIVEEDRIVKETSYYAVEAETLDEAIGKISKIEPHNAKMHHPTDDFDYSDSHEATEEEWEEYFPKASVKLKM